MENNFRKNGSIGALLDEYEKSILELNSLIRSISHKELITIADELTKDPECKSIQTVLSHVITSGYGYAVVIRKTMGEEIDYRDDLVFNSKEEYQEELLKMFEFNVLLFDDYPNIKLEEFKNEHKILVRWGQRYDVDQLMEHAIVHVLRHRRQIQKFLYKLRS